jgi:three-Cys-motif partner protein
MKTSFYQNREQTEVKHRALERYLQAFIPIVGSWASDIVYVDCLAGPWKAEGQNLEDTSFYKAISVLREAKHALSKRGKNPSFRCLLIDNRPEAFSELKAFASSISEINVEARDWDFSTSVPKIVGFVKERPNAFPFIFIDPTGWELAAVNLITPLLQLKPGEVLINLMTSWITRFLTDETKPFEKLVGGNIGRLRQLNGEDLEDELVSCYTAAVRSAGKFRYACSLPILKAAHDAIHFYLIYGTRHVRGVEVFKEMEKTVISFMHETRAEAQSRKKFEKSGGQYTFLTPEESYSEKRFSRLHEKNSEAVRGKLFKALQTKGSILYDDIWGACMQYPTLTEADIRSWLQHWKESQLIEILNAPANQRFPKRKTDQIIKWIGS